MVDSHTLTLVLLMLGVILGLCTFGLRATLPDDFRGLNAWGSALLAFGLAVVLAALASQQRIAYSWLSLAGALYVCAAILLAVAVRQFVERPVSGRWAILLTVLAFLPHGAWVLLWPQPLLRQIWLMCVVLAVCWVCLDALWRSPAARQAMGGRMLLLGFALIALSALARIGFSLSGETDPSWVFAPSSQMAQWFLLLSSAALLINSIGMILLATERLRRILEHMASHDALTGLLVRSGFQAPAEHSLLLAKRRNESVALLVCDIDHFKAINDLHGHPGGDAALVQIAEVLRTHARASDLVARFGGEEFVLLLPTCDQHTALDFAERLRARVESAALAYQGEAVALTVSIGVAVAERDQLSLPRLYQRADRALYAAKRAGRNRVRLAFDETQNPAQKLRNAQF